MFQIRYQIIFCWLLDTSIKLLKYELKHFPDRVSDYLHMFGGKKKAVDFTLNKLDPVMLKAVIMSGKDNMPWQQISDAASNHEER